MVSRLYITTKSVLLPLLYEAIQDESVIFRDTHSMLYFLLENVVPEILRHIHCNNPVNVPLTFVHYGKILHAGMALRQIWHSALPHAILKEGLVMCSDVRWTEGWAVPNRNNFCFTELSLAL